MQVVQSLCRPPESLSDPVMLAFARRGRAHWEDSLANEPMSMAARGLALALIAAAEALGDTDEDSRRRA